MYFIGPLLFWACAEMTCGFFILSVPCLPSILKEAKLPTMIKSILSLSSKSSSNPENPSSLITFGGSNEAKTRPRAADPYYQVFEEDGRLPLRGLITESQEQLRPGQGKPPIQVMRTTDIVVSSDARSAGSASDLENNSTPWTKSV